MCDKSLVESVAITIYILIVFQCLVLLICTCTVLVSLLIFLMCSGIQHALCSPGPDLVVCDEGHRIKNDATNLSQALKKLRTKSVHTIYEIAKVHTCSKDSHLTSSATCWDPLLSLET